MVKKFISELVGTMFLVIFGCGTAVAATKVTSPVFAQYSLLATTIIIALAFGLILTSLIYTIGRVSGCHVNPAVSIAMVISGKIKPIECAYYVVAQLVGAIAGAEVLGLLFGSYEQLGINGYDSLSAIKTTMYGALAVEVILTFIFVLVILCVTTRKEEQSNNGLIIGLTLTLVHIFGLPFTGTSVNPARSFGPALICSNSLALEQLWVFIVGPIIGAILAALFFKYLINDIEPNKKTKKTRD